MELLLDRTGVATRPVLLPAAAELCAHGLSNVLTPPVCAVLAVALVVAHAPTVAAVCWAGVVIAVGTAVPTGYVVHLHRSGRLSDLHMNVRHERLRPLLVAATCSLAALGLLGLGGAPRLLIAVAAVQAGQVALLLFVTLRWKMSAHSAGVACLAVVCWWLFGVSALPVVGLVPAMAWARVYLARHTVGQVAAGTLAGGLPWLPILALVPVG